MKINKKYCKKRFHLFKYTYIIKRENDLGEKKYEKVAIFAHGGVLICAQLYAGAIKQEEAFSALTPYGGIIQLRLD